MSAVAKLHKLPSDVRRLFVASYVQASGELCASCPFYCGDWCPPCSYLCSWRTPACCELSQYDCMRYLYVSRTWRAKKVKF